MAAPSALLRSTLPARQGHLPWVSRRGLQPPVRYRIVSQRNARRLAERKDLLLQEALRKHRPPSYHENPSPDEGISW